MKMARVLDDALVDFKCLDWPMRPRCAVARDDAVAMANVVGRITIPRAFERGEKKKDSFLNKLDRTVKGQELYTRGKKKKKKKMVVLKWERACSKLVLVRLCRGGGGATTSARSRPPGRRFSFSWSVSAACCVASLSRCASSPSTRAINRLRVVSHTRKKLSHCLLWAGLLRVSCKNNKVIINRCGASGGRFL